MMKVVNALIGCALLALALLHVFIPHSTPHALIITAMYSLGAVLAFASLYTNMGMTMARIMALGTTAAMFFYFAGFFRIAPHFNDAWYQSGIALEGIGMILSAFAMIPVLSCYSCILKADCREKLAPPGNRAFFSVPDSVQEKTS